MVSDFLENKKQDTQNTRDYNAGVQRREKDGKVMRAYNQYNKQGTATKAHTYRTATLQIVMWLMAFVTMFILALQPILQSRNTLVQAGLTSNDEYYANAPMTVIGGSVDESTHTINDGTKPLFTSSGVNADVLQELLKVINDASVWGEKSVPTDDSVTYLSAKDFGNYGDQSSWADTAKGNAQIVLKLLDTTSVTTNNVDDAAAQCWQIVYRSTSANEDVLTLYMTNPYMTNQFNPEEQDGIYRYEGNYSQSYLRDKAVLPTYEAMKSTYSQLDQYVVTPSQVPGLWQSSAYQTSANDDNQYYNGTVSNSGASEKGDYALGTSGCWQNNSYYNLENGLDGLSVSKTSGTQWQGDIVSAYTDKLWIPSAFEVLHTGYAGEDTTIQDTGRTFDEGEGVSYVSNNTSASATLGNVTSGEDGRTGLWELNGYDRTWGDTTNGSWAWLRSGDSNHTVRPREINCLGVSNGNGVNPANGVRVALHLNLKSLASNLLGTDSVPTPPTYYYSINLQAETQIEADTNALLIVSSVNEQAFMYRLSATNTQINITMPKLVVGRTYTITVINGEISGTLSATSGATVTQTPYTFVCNTEDAEITLSGLTIS